MTKLIRTEIDPNGNKYPVYECTDEEMDIVESMREGSSIQEVLIDYEKVNPDFIILEKFVHKDKEWYSLIVWTFKRKYPPESQIPEREFS